ncbi:MAG: bis(5'-nucleosyl)-tetraphosphatase (symmetrical) YqeK [Oribacterium sp.]|nr:bis(5'-nucleosyl)-tetraphosphatase (symmetrical) YqeK [Oribacterium sp.]MBO6307496.1 bis(5'-nucleosyl)-tetraphosphatase (symmetrical) YqeK [Oribacterium sp.]MBP3805623.1 bis(5'-nucleosyl)-tetraphosphatase (symmetrical) YqeK [Oribacterium sp.]MBR1857560.1 bis(5'-nucleosyl)-tetraphosphatase (symmetrical) YqeK [Oribacterium sp.]
MASDKKAKKNGDKPDISEIYEYRRKLKKLLKPDRYEHSLSVSFTCVCLAMRYGVDLYKAEVAGLVHDCAKQFSDEELIKLCKKEKVELTDDMLKAPQVIHSVFGAVYARKEFGIEDGDVLSAIYYHTLGKPDMSLLEAIVFTADYIEARRYKASRLTEIRRLAFEDLDRAVYEINHDTITYLEESGGFICKDSYDTYRYYKELIETRWQPIK